MKSFRILVLAVLTTVPARAQDQVITPPPNLVLNNYDTVPVGPYGGLEGSAYSARVGDPSAAWFNPAGLSRQTTAQISGSAGVYELTSVSPDALPNRGGSLQQLPNYVGFTLTPRTGMSVGVALLTSSAWKQQTDSELVNTVATGQQRFAYTADSDYQQRVAAIGVGFHRGGAWRYGGGFAFSMLDMRLVQSASDRIAESNRLRSLLVGFRADGSAFLMRLQAGAQYDRGAWRFGAAVRTPGLTMFKSAKVTLDGLLDEGATSQGASLFDADADFEFHQPWEFQGGVAYVRDRVQLEIDVQGYTGVSAYPLISSDQPTVTYSDSGTGAPPTVVTRPFGGLTSASDGVVNVSIGGDYQVLKNRTLRIHGGVGSNRSPVGGADVVFTKVNLASWTLGLSGSVAKVQFAAGLNWKSGTADALAVRNLLNGEIIRSTTDIRTMGFIYSLAYQF